MGLLDDLSKTVAHGIERARFETDKFQRISRIQGDINDLKRKLDNKMIDLGHRAYDLHRAGQISSPSVAELVQVIDELRANLVVRQEHLKAVQTEAFVEPVQAPSGATQAQSIPIQDDIHSSQDTASLPQKKECPVCKFEMSMRAVFCPNCGYKVGS